MPIFAVLIFLLICGAGVAFLAMFVFALRKRRRGWILLSGLPATLFLFYIASIAFGPFWHEAPQVIFTYAFKREPPANIAFTHGYEAQGFFPGCTIFLEFTCNEQQFEAILNEKRFIKAGSEAMNDVPRDTPTWWMPAQYTPDKYYVSEDFPGPYFANKAVLVRDDKSGRTFFFMNSFE